MASKDPKKFKRLTVSIDIRLYEIMLKKIKETGTNCTWLVENALDEKFAKELKKAS